MFKKLMASVGVGNATVDTIVKTENKFAVFLGLGEFQKNNLKAKSLPRNWRNILGVNGLAN